MDTLIFEFKARVRDDGSFTRPNLDVKHVVGAFNDLQLKIASGCN